MLRFDGEGRILSANAAAVETLGQEAKEGVQLASLLPDMAGIDLERHIREDLVTIHEDMVGQRHFQFVIRGLSEFGFGHVYGSDITERKQAEKALHELAVLEERNRLARDIHDTLAQGLTGIIWQLNAAARTVEGGGEQALRSLHRIRDLARDCLQEARRSVWDLRAGPLGGTTLAKALRQETENITAGEIKTIVSVSGEERVLPSGVEVALLRICQESLANILKHARATQVSVTLAYDDSNIRFKIQDNGIGFDPDMPRRQDREGGGFGLINMRERARLLGGELAVRSEPGRGTLVEATLPLS